MKSFVKSIFLLGALISFQYSSGQNKDIFKTKGPELQSILNQTVDGKKVFGTSFCLKYKGQEWCGTAGNFEPESFYFIASTTKLFVTAIILNLRSKGQLALNDKISKYLDSATLKNLQVFKGVDYSYQITIEQLLAHTSGIPDYFQGKPTGGKSLEDKLISGEDQYWSFSQAIELSKTISPTFKPGAKGKALYSDTNYQLLGKIIEMITQKSFAKNCSELIIKPLGLSKTYLFTNAEDGSPKTIYYKNHELKIPKAMTSFGPDGGYVSNSSDMLLFIENFMKGKFFPKEYLNEIQVWNPIFPPLESGIGIHRFKLPKIINPGGTIPIFIGHSGLSGAFAYYCPEKELFIAGTVNQIAYPSTSFKTAVKLVQKTLAK